MFKKFDLKLVSAEKQSRGGHSAVPVREQVTPASIVNTGCGPDVVEKYPLTDPAIAVRDRRQQ